MGVIRARARGELVETGKRVSGWISHARNASWAGGLIAAAWIALATFGNHIPYALQVAAILALNFLLGMLCGAFLFRSVSRRRDTGLGYRVLAVEYEYSFGDVNIRQHKQRVVFDIEARRSNVYILENRYWWTGEGARPAIQLEDVSHTLLLHESMVYDRWQHYFVHFRNPLLRGEKQPVVITQTMRDDAGEFKPLLTSMFLTS